MGVASGNVYDAPGGEIKFYRRRPGMNIASYMKPAEKKLSHIRNRKRLHAFFCFSIVCINAKIALFNRGEQGLPNYTHQIKIQTL